jgi:hypothetical protein
MVLFCRSNELTADLSIRAAQGMSRAHDARSILIFQPPLELRERHHHVGAVGGTFGERAVPALDVGHVRPRDVDAELAVEVGAGGNVGEREPVAEQEWTVGEHRVQ